jgi:hypothetical protein
MCARIAYWLADIEVQLWMVDKPCQAVLRMDSVQGTLSIPILWLLQQFVLLRLCFQEG